MRLFVFLVIVASAQHQGNPAEQHGSQAHVPHKRFEYKYSFKPPYLAQKDGTVPFFEYSGNAIASQDNVRITPSLKSQRGMIWSRLASTFEWWEVEMHFRVTGRGRVGADGLAFWYTATKGMLGPVFGTSDMWNGLSVFFDSYDNDNAHNNPYIMAMNNDGSQLYDHQKDGSTQQLAGCLRDYRNKPFPVRAKIEYYLNVLTVRIHNGMANNDKDYELCMRVENVFLPKQGFFGISAATGGLADDHDVIKLLVSSLKTPETGKEAAFDDQDSKQIQQEFEEYQQKLKLQKELWVKEHPDEVKSTDIEEDYDNWLGENELESQQIFQGLSAVKSTLQQLDLKMDGVVASQERAQQHLSVLRASSGGGGVQQGGPAVDSIRREEVNAILANQREIVNAARDIKNFVADIHGKTGQILNKGTGSAQPVGGAFDFSMSIKEIRDTLNSVRHEFASASQRLTSATTKTAGCPDVSNLSCVSATVLIVAVAIHLVLLISYLAYRDGKEAKAKKFY